MSLVTPNTSIKEMLKRIKAAHKSESGYLKKLSDFNKGIQELHANIEKLVLPTEEAKLKAQKQIEMKKEKEPVYPKTDAEIMKEEKERERHNKLNKDIIDLLNLLTKKDVIDNRTSIDILDSLDKNTEASTNTTVKLLEQLVENAGENNKQITDLIEKLNEANVLNKEAINTFINAQSTVTDKGNILIGNETIGVKYNEDLKLYYLKYKQSERQMTENGFNELISKNAFEDLSNITKPDFITYGNIINDIKPTPNTTNHPELVGRIIEKIGRASSSKTINERLSTLYNELTITKTGEGLSTIILPSSTKDLKNRLQLIIASIQAGNNSNDLKNEASEIIDQLSKNKRFSRNQISYFYSLINDTRD